MKNFNLKKLKFKNYLKQIAIKRMTKKLNLKTTLI